MYWPLGAPRIHAAVASRRKAVKREDDEDGQKEEAETDISSLLGIRVSRNGHLLVTISATALTVWQTLVGDVEPSPNASD